MSGAGEGRGGGSHVQAGRANYGYEGHLGSFVATKDANALALIVVHHYPDMEKVSLGRTKLTYEGPKRLGNIDGWGVHDGMEWHHLSVEDFFQLRKGLLRRWRQLLHRSRLPE